MDEFTLRLRALEFAVGLAVSGAIEGTAVIAEAQRYFDFLREAAKPAT